MMANWRDETHTRWANWTAEIEALDRVLAEFPGLEQSKPVEDGLSPVVRFTVQLVIEPSEHHQPPQIFVVVNPEDSLGAKGTPGGLESMFKKSLDTSVQRDGGGSWRAVSGGDLIRWVFDDSKKRWVKEKSVAA